MRMKAIEIKIELGSIGNMGIGSVADTDWIVEKIRYFGMNEENVVIICDCIHAEDWPF